MQTARPTLDKFKYKDFMKSTRCREKWGFSYENQISCENRRISIVTKGQLPGMVKAMFFNLTFNFD